MTRLKGEGPLRRRAGVSLLEVMITISLIVIIIGIFAAATVPRAKLSTGTATLRAEIAGYASAQERYAMRNFVYAPSPSSIPGFVFSSTLTVVSSSGSATLWTLVIRDPKTGVQCSADGGPDGGTAPPACSGTS